MNLLSCGGMGDGKTTLLCALASDIPREERLVTVESAYELALDPFTERHHHQVVALEAREANVEDVGRINCADLVCWAMRMRANRVIVGEGLVTRVAAALNPAAERPVDLVARASNDAAAAADGVATCPDAARLRWLRPECQPRSPRP
jgi:type IV secretory pathway ATPase VirB11/archaellum biosynthesis ATPase